MRAYDLANVKELLQFLEPSFPTITPKGPAYDNMAALLADVSLQAGIDYNRIVRPRVVSILEMYPDCIGIRDVDRILQRTSVRGLLRWNGTDKISRFQSIFELLFEHHIESIEHLASWSDSVETRGRFLSIRGVGNKTVDYLRMLCGREAFPLDRHFIRFLHVAGVDIKGCGYDYAQRLLADSCHELGLDPRGAEKGLWLLLRACV